MNAWRFNSDLNNKLPIRGAADEAGQIPTMEMMANLRASTGLFGEAYLAMLARQITVDLRQIRCSIKPDETKEPVSKGTRSGELVLTTAGVWHTSKVTGFNWLSVISATANNPPSLVIRPWHQASNVNSFREFSNNAYNQHHGMQSTECFSVDTDPDGDSVKNKLTRANITVSVFQAGLQVPVRVIPRDHEIEAAVLEGEKVFRQIGCGRIPLAALRTPFGGGNSAIVVAAIAYSLIVREAALPTVAHAFPDGLPDRDSFNAITPFGNSRVREIQK